MIIVSTETNYLIGEVSLPWNQEVEVSDQDGLKLLAYPGVREIPSKPELISESKTRSKLSKKE